MSKANAATKAEIAPEATETKVVPISPLLASEMWAREAGVRVNTFEIVPREGTPTEHLLRPDFWANVSTKLIPGSSIIVIPGDGRYYAELIVQAAGKNWAQVHFKPGFPIVWGEAMQAPSADYLDVIHHPSRGWMVRHRETLRVYKDHLPNADEANRAKADYYRVTGQ